MLYSEWEEGKMVTSRPSNFTEWDDMKFEMGAGDEALKESKDKVVDENSCIRV